MSEKINNPVTKTKLYKALSLQTREVFALLNVPLNQNLRQIIFGKCFKLKESNLLLHESILRFFLFLNFTVFIMCNLFAVLCHKITLITLIPILSCHNLSDLYMFYVIWNFICDKYINNIELIILSIINLQLSSVRHVHVFVQMICRTFNFANPKLYTYLLNSNSSFHPLLYFFKN